MVYRHRRTSNLYRVLLQSFSEERQRPSFVYVSLVTGAVFDCDAASFAQSFESVSDPQVQLRPRPRPAGLPG